MNYILSAFLGFASAVVFVIAFVNLFILRGWNLVFSLAMSLTLAGSLFVISIFFDRRHRRLHLLPYREVLPSKLGVLSFLSVVYFAVALVCLFAAVVYGWLQIPAGDHWEIAVTRLIYVFVVVLLGWQSYNAVTRFAQRFFRGYVYDDYLESWGTPQTLGQICSEFRRECSTFWLVIFTVVSIAVLCDVLELAEQMMQWKGGGRRFRKYKWMLGWLLKNPNTVDLFAITTLVTSISAIGWRLYRFLFDRMLIGEEDE